ncbi:MAG: serine/threonine-protein kinase, partial [Planctomycetota bacterium]
SIEDYVARYPDYERDIREIFPTLVQLERAAESITETSDRVQGLAPEAGLAVGDRFGDFEILGELGRGGMGIVYEAEQVSLHRRVALKILPKPSLMSASQLERFRVEARVAARLQHPHIVPVHEVGEWNGVHFYAMQLISGSGLDVIVTQLKESDNVPGDRRSNSGSSTGSEYFRNCARITQQAAGALAYAHEQGILHRDIKPSNLLLDERDSVWITDFGLAKTEEDDGLTHSGDVVGTLRYLAPERFNAWADARTDVYSLGATLYELLTLRPAFAGTDRARLVRDILSGSFPSPRRIDRRIPKDLETIVLVAMHREAERRYPSAAAMAEDLARFSARRPIQARRSSPGERLALWFRRNPVVATLVSCVAILLSVVAVGGVLTALHLNDVAEEKEKLAERVLGEQRATLQNLRAAHLAEARARRTSRTLGQRHAAIEALVAAAGIEPGADIRDEAIAALARFDLDENAAFRLDRAHRAFAFSPDFTRYAHYRAEQIEVCSSIDHSVIKSFHSPGPEAWKVWWSPNGRFIVSVFGDELRAWSIDDGSQTVSIPKGARVAQLRFSRDSTFFAVGISGSVHVVVPSSGEVLQRMKTPSFVRGIAISADGKLLAVSNTNVPRVQIWRVSDGRKLRELDVATPAAGLAWHPSGDLLFAGCDNGEVVSWQTEQWESGRTLDAHHNTVVELQFSPTGDVLSSYSYDARAILWEPRLGRRLVEREGRTTQFSRDGRRMGLRLDGEVRIFEVSRPKFYRGLP